MHFLGLAGMPRRIPDYPDIYFVWNHISSVGSLVSVIGLFVFFFIIFEIITENNLFLDYKNNHLIILDTANWANLGLKFSEDFDVKGATVPSHNVYVFNKYNFFQVHQGHSLFVWKDTYLYANFLDDYAFFISNPKARFDMFHLGRTMQSAVFFFSMLYGKRSLTDAEIHELLNFYITLAVLDKCFKTQNNKFYYNLLNLIAKEKKLAYYLKFKL